MTAFRSPFGSQEVPRTAETKRIAALPRRTWSDADAARLADMLTKELKTPGGTMKLRSVQAIALFEAMECGGLFGPIRVGAGKSLITAVLPAVLEARRPVLLIPAALIEKTGRDFKALREHWKIATNLQLISYESLGLVQSAEKLEYIRPDLVVADECFVAGTPIRTARGVRAIETICVGDLVETTEGFQEVRDAWSRGSEDLYEISIGTNSYACTGSHPFLTTGGWRPARELEAGNEVVRNVQETLFSEARVARVTSVKRRRPDEAGYRARVYNLSVAGPENYVLGGGEVVHNCHMLKNRRAGRTRRVMRFMREYPETRFVGVSGTVMKGSLQDFAHLLRWALKGASPIPLTDEEVKAWADAIDEKVNPLGRRRPGALLNLGPSSPAADGVTRARRVFQSRLLETKGVVASSRTDGVTCSLRVSALEYQPAPITEQHVGNMLHGLQENGVYTILPWTTPDGWTFSQAIELRMYLRQLALGFHSVWDPRPPSEWISARRGWAVFVRETLANSRTLDTELQVANAVDVGRFGEQAQEILGAWRVARDTFKIQPKDVWHDDSALQACVRWMEHEKGIVWCEHRFFARRLAQISGHTYYGANGMTDGGQSITDVKAGKAIIASVQANGTGRNLQMFSSNLITSCPPGAQTAEQLIGRTHRDGQEADTVTVDILIGCREHYDSFQRALDGARAAADTLGHMQKLLVSDVCMPDISSRRGPLW